MKKVGLAILFSLLCVISNAQIQRNFFGMQLGYSTVTDVKQKMMSIGHPVKEQERNCVYVAEKIKFAGVNCKKVYFNFYKNKLSRVTFIIDRLYESRKNEIVTEYETWKIKLDNKYSDLVSYNTDDTVVYKDKDAQCLLYYSLSNYMYYLFISYSDINLIESQRQENNNEL